MKLSFIVIDSEEKRLAYLSKIRFLFHFLPEHYKKSPENLLLGRTVLVFLNEHTPLALYELEGVNDATVELHGVFRQDWRKDNRLQYKIILTTVIENLLQLVFFELKKTFIQIQVDKRNKGARGFTLRCGFKFQQKIDDEVNLYQLDRNQYFNHFLKRNSPICP